ncbi:TPA: hypothetical protein QDB21_005618 [Burkholderia vietnamiensis]|nr:hypothetical protein [Burkholderia vietnamiensis]
MMAIDTHKAYRALIDAGLSDKQADAILKVVSDQGDGNVTKSDLEVSLSKLETKLITWQIGIGFAIVGLIKLVLH